MKYSFKPEIVTTFRVLVFRLPKEIELVETFLFADVPSREGFGDFFLEAIDQVLSGTEPFLSVGGNACALEIRADYTRVLDTLADDGEGEACEIETVELKQLIEIWLDHLEKFREEEKSRNDHDE